MFKKPPSDVKLEKAIERVLDHMTTETMTSDDYAKDVDHLVKLHTLKANQAKQRVSKDVLITVGANLAGIILILTHERVHVVTTKALSLVMKAR